LNFCLKGDKPHLLSNSDTEAPPSAFYDNSDDSQQNSQEISDPSGSDEDGEERSSSSETKNEQDPNDKSDSSEKSEDVDQNDEIPQDEFGGNDFVDDLYIPDAAPPDQELKGDDEPNLPTPKTLRAAPSVELSSLFLRSNWFKPAVLILNPDDVIVL